MKTDSGLYAVVEIEPESSVSAVYAKRLYGNNSRATFYPLKADYLQLTGFFERQDPVKESLRKTKLVLTYGIEPFFFFLLSI